MKTTTVEILCLLMSLAPAFGAEPTWSWTAPDPPLPDTQYWDYGWDSTSNGVAAPLESAAIRKAREPLRLAGHAAAERVGHFYADQFLTLRTPDFTSQEMGYGVGVGYQVNANWGADLRLEHEGLDFNGSMVQGIGVRLTARMPFKYLSPYGFLGGSFNLERNFWEIQPGAGIEITPSKSMKRLAIFLEGQLNADVQGRNTYGFQSGIRWRF